MKKELIKAKNIFIVNNKKKEIHYALLYYFVYLIQRCLAIK